MQSCPSYCAVASLKVNFPPSSVCFQNFPCASGNHQFFCASLSMVFFVFVFVLLRVCRAPEIIELISLVMFILSKALVEQLVKFKQLL